MNIVSRSEAKALGLPRYFTGEPCRNGHVRERLLTNSTCLGCKSGTEKRRYSADPVASKKRTTAWATKNREQANQIAKNWRERHPEKEALAQKKQREKKPEYYSASAAQRNAQKLRATVPWADQAKIKAIYDEAARLSKVTGVKHHVDHYYPLQGELCCGLHVETNLQILTYSENCKKSNKMPEDFYQHG